MNKKWTRNKALNHLALNMIGKAFWRDCDVNCYYVKKELGIIMARTIDTEERKAIREFALYVMKRPKGMPMIYKRRYAGLKRRFAKLIEKLGEKGISMPV